jgi:hypothetical protein
MSSDKRGENPRHRKEGVSRPEIGSSGASVVGVEDWRKQSELRHESDPLRRGSGRHQASEKSSKHHKPPGGPTEGVDERLIREGVPSGTTRPRSVARTRDVSNKSQDIGGDTCSSGDATAEALCSRHSRWS